MEFRVQSGIAGRLSPRLKPITMEIISNNEGSSHHHRQHQGSKVPISPESSPCRFYILAGSMDQPLHVPRIQGLHTGRVIPHQDGAGLGNQGEAEDMELHVCLPAFSRARGSRH